MNKKTLSYYLAWVFLILYLPVLVFVSVFGTSDVSFVKRALGLLFMFIFIGPFVFIAAVFILTVVVMLVEIAKGKSLGFFANAEDARGMKAILKIGYICSLFSVPAAAAGIVELMYGAGWRNSIWIGKVLDSVITTFLEFAFLYIILWGMQGAILNPVFARLLRFFPKHTNHTLATFTFYAAEMFVFIGISKWYFNSLPWGRVFAPDWVFSALAIFGLFLADFIVSHHRLKRKMPS